MRYFIFILALLLAAPVFSVAQPLERDGAPFIGAQVFIEPGAEPSSGFSVLQGGNNVYSGGEAMCPTPDEIMQWLWIVAGTEGCVLFQSLDGKGTQCRSPFG